MERKLITITKNGYVLKEIILNKELIFYHMNNNNIDINMFDILYFSYNTKRILLGDSFNDNDIKFIYINNYVKVKLHSFKEMKRKINS